MLASVVGYSLGGVGECCEHPAPETTEKRQAPGWAYTQILQERVLRFGCRNGSVRARHLGGTKPVIRRPHNMQFDEIAKELPALRRLSGMLHMLILVMSRSTDDTTCRSGLASPPYSVYRLQYEPAREAYRDSLRAFGCEAVSCELLGRAMESDAAS